ncbi:MAG: universal stress protein [Betaproteobacteria bacterium]|jgi:nucleotide-binding universal stress UspA family protein|nr:universal stress protein [Betaproteobacteria bacterium]NBP45840.1 universal stress protein [Betaproteobacteria bacterium]
MKILVPTDGSASALRAAKYAAKLLADDEHGRITLLSVHDDEAFRRVRKYVPKGAIADYIRELSETELKPARAALDRAGVAHDMVMRTGAVAQEIVKLGHSGGFDLIVMGTKGRSAFGDLLMGSVAQKVLSATQLPVTFIK